MSQPNDGEIAPASPKTRKPLRRVVEAFASPNRYGLLLVLILITYSISVWVSGAWGLSIALVTQMLTLWLAIHTSEAWRFLRVVATVLLIIAAFAAALNLVLDEEHTPWFAELMSILMYAVAPSVIMRHLILRDRVDRRALLGALSAYLMLGMFFAFLYRFIGTVQSSPFFGAQGDATTAQDLFFSFTTLTTTGYGNLVPAGNPGQSVAVMEMITGQLFMLAAIGKFISVWKPKVRR